METVTEFLDKFLFWHWGIVAVALGALEMLFAGGILMGAAIAALLVGAAAFADQQFPGALPPGFDFGIKAQLATFAVLTVVFAVAMRVGRTRAAAMIAKASEKPAAPAQPAAPVAPPAPAPAAAPMPPAKLSPQPPVQPLASPPLAPQHSLRPATAARPIARPAGNQPMRVTGPTAVTTPPTAPPTPRPVRQSPAAPVAPAAPPAPAPAPAPRPPARPAAPRTPPKAPAPAAPPPPSAKPAANPNDFVGKEYTLWKPIAAGKGSLRIAGADWSLTGPDVAAGSRVRVVGVEGQTLRVEPAG